MTAHVHPCPGCYAEVAWSTVEEAQAACDRQLVETGVVLVETAREGG